MKRKLTEDINNNISNQSLDLTNETYKNKLITNFNHLELTIHLLTNKSQIPYWNIVNETINKISSDSFDLNDLYTILTVYCHGYKVHWMLYNGEYHLTIYQSNNFISLLDRLNEFNRLLDIKLLESSIIPINHDVIPIKPIVIKNNNDIIKKSINQQIVNKINQSIDLKSTSSLLTLREAIKQREITLQTNKQNEVNKIIKNNQFKQFIQLPVLLDHIRVYCIQRKKQNGIINELINKLVHDLKCNKENLYNQLILISTLLPDYMIINKIKVDSKCQIETFTIDLKINYQLVKKQLTDEINRQNSNNNSDSCNSSICNDIIIE